MPTGKYKASPCWIWPVLTSNGYGHFGQGPNRRYAHRESYRALVGEIPKDKVLDHLCSNRACVNPDHLEAVTLGENTRRGRSAIVRCKNGHDYTPANTGGRPSKRVCKACRATQYAAKKERNSAHADG